MEPRAHKKELPLAVQFAAMYVLWLAWLAAVVGVQWRAWVLSQYFETYASPAEVYLPLFGGIPLVLGAAGHIFLKRAGPADKLGVAHRFLYGGIELLSILGLLIGGGSCLCCVAPLFEPRVRE
jgi:hypothetical protein